VSYDYTPTELKQFKRLKFTKLGDGELSLDCSALTVTAGQAGTLVGDIPTIRGTRAGGKKTLIVTFKPLITPLHDWYGEEIAHEIFIRLSAYLK
jgi:hypothetical protein